MRDKSDELASLGVVILGASFDSIEDNRAFSDEHGFGYSLLSDVGREVGSVYGVLRDPGSPAEGLPKRISYLIDPAGLVRMTYEVSDPAGHAQQVIGDLLDLRE